MSGVASDKIAANNRICAHLMKHNILIAAFGLTEQK